MSFQPSTIYPPIVYGKSPSEHHAQGRLRQRGDADFVMSRTELVEFAKCPRKWLKRDQEVVTPAMEFGDLVDCLTLTPDRLKRDYAIAPDTYTDVPEKYILTSAFEGEWNPRTAACRGWKAELEAEGFAVLTPGQLAEAATGKPWNWNAAYCYKWGEEALRAGKTVVKAAQVVEAQRARASLLSDAEIVTILDSSRKQVQINVEWHDRSGVVVPVKCLLDLVPDPASPVGDTAWDLKTTIDASEDAWPRKVFHDHLDWQAAMYLDALRCVLGKGYRSFGHVIVESEPPYEVTHRPLSEEFLNRGRDRYRAALGRYCRCLKSGEWPGYGTQVTEPEPWMMLA